MKLILETQGNVGALVQNVTYGLSNSAAKVTGSLSEGLGRVTMDEKHEEVRQRILKHQVSPSFLDNQVKQELTTSFCF